MLRRFPGAGGCAAALRGSRSPGSRVPPGGALSPPRAPRAAASALAPPCGGSSAALPCRRRGQDGGSHGAELLGRRLGAAVPAPGVSHRHGNGRRPPSGPGGRERRRPGACPALARTSAELLLASGEAGGGRRDVGPAVRSWLVPRGRHEQRCRPSRRRRALPGGTAALPGDSGASPSIPWSLLRAIKLSRNPSRTYWWLVLSARRCLTQLLKPCFTLFLHIVTGFFPYPPIFIAGLRQIFWCSPDSEYYK